jgi:hypothetical protein
LQEKATKFPDTYGEFSRLSGEYIANFMENLEIHTTKEIE